MKRICGDDMWTLKPSELSAETTQRDGKMIIVDSNARDRGRRGFHFKPRFFGPSYQWAPNPDNGSSSKCWSKHAPDNGFDRWHATNVPGNAWLSSSAFQYTIIDCIAERINRFITTILMLSISFSCCPFFLSFVAPVHLPVCTVTTTLDSPVVQTWHEHHEEMPRILRWKYSWLGQQERRILRLLGVDDPVIYLNMIHISRFYTPVSYSLSSLV